MEKEFVNSTSIDKARYEAEDERLYVTFKNSNATYSYDEVPLDVVQEFFEASSPGSYFRKHIARSFKYRRIGHGML